VGALAKRLERSGFEVILDQWHLALGDRIAQFIEEAIQSCDFVLLICTPVYKKRGDRREGGVGYEQDIMTAEKLIHRSDKFIPVLRAGSWYEATPTWLAGTFGVDLSGDPYNDDNYRYLKASLAKKAEVSDFATKKRKPRGR